MLQEELHETIKNFPDFPSKGILFRDILPVLQKPKLYKKLIESMASKDFFNKADAIIAIDARGFLFASSIAIINSIPLILARKPGKLPGTLISSEYELEYGANSLSIQKDSISSYEKFVIVDDLLATGGTVNCVTQILKEKHKEILGLSIVIELKDLRGRDLFEFPVESELQL